VDTAVLLLVLASVPLGLASPWAGAVIFGWLGFLLPTRVVHGEAFGLTLGWLPVAAAVAGLARSRWRAPLPRSREMLLLLAFWAFCGLTTATAVNPERSLRWLLELSRILVMVLVVMSLSRRRRVLEALMWLTALALAWYALGGAAWVLATGGAEPLYGPRGSNILNNNDLGAALVAVLPFFAFLAPHTPRPWMRHAALVPFALVVVATLGTYSRGALLSLLLVFVLLAAWRQGRALAVAALAVAVFLSFTSPRKLLERADTIRTFRQEESASMRLEEWYVAFRLGLDHPLLGAGFRPFNAEVYKRYVPDSTDRNDAHNLFLQVFAEHGFPGVALYAALLVSTFATLWRLARAEAGDADAAWRRDAARAVLVGLAAYVLDGQFQCLSYRVNYFELLALAILLDTLPAPAPLPGRVPGASLAHPPG